MGGNRIPCPAPCKSQNRRKVRQFDLELHSRLIFHLQLLVLKNPRKFFTWDANRLIEITTQSLAFKTGIGSITYCIFGTPKTLDWADFTD